MKIKLLFCVVVALFINGGVQRADEKATSGFDQLKVLAGDWVGTTSEGKSGHASYQVVSAGSALLERLQGEDESEMVTVYTADGDRVAVTHYCSVGNQPQMLTEPITGQVTEFTFNFVRATNLKSPDDGHMVGLVVRLQDKDHFTQTWTFQEKGKKQTEKFTFTRKKGA